VFQGLRLRHEISEAREGSNLLRVTYPSDQEPVSWFLTLGPYIAPGSLGSDSPQAVLRQYVGMMKGALTVALWPAGKG
jgi:hypothetical protein